MSRKFLLTVLLIIIATVLVACGRAASESIAYDEAMSPPMEEMESAEALPRDAGGMALSTSDTAADSSPEMPQANQMPQERLIIRTADMSIIVTSTDDAMLTITNMVNENGGWVVNSNVYEVRDGLKTGSMTVRVPAEGFQSALDAIELLAVDVNEVSTSGQDVTEEFVDLSARLDNLEATAERVRGFLDETENVEEALAVNQELSRLEGDIEVIKGRMQYLSQSAAFSTIHINLSPDALSQPIQVAGWEPQGVAKDALETLIDALQGLVDIAIWLVIFVLPIALLIGIPIWLIIRAIRKRRARRKESAESSNQ